MTNYSFDMSLEPLCGPYTKYPQILLPKYDWIQDSTASDSNGKLNGIGMRLHLFPLRWAMISDRLIDRPQK